MTVLHGPRDCGMSVVIWGHVTLSHHEKEIILILSSWIVEHLN